MLQDLNARFAKPGLQFEQGNGGLVRATVNTPAAKAELYLQGAHVTAWTPSGHEPVLWLSECSYFEKGKPIRGGVPICFPWFGPNAADATAPAHGYARIVEWKVASTEIYAEGNVVIQLQATIEDFALQFEVDFGRTLKMNLQTHLLPAASAPRSFEDAMHTYLSIGDVHTISIRGLEDTSYIDKMDGGNTQPAASEPIRFDRETDRVYFDTHADCVLHDPAKNRILRVAKKGSSSTVIWNPWIEKSKRMPDFGDTEWPQMVCIETANVASNRVQLEPGKSHATTAILSVE